MTSINRLQSGVCSSLRSSIILLDLPRVVEELTYNSVDAGATKVYVSLNVKTCYIKVEDDGCGITRDDLVILGERYATSKVHLLAGTQTKGENFGFRGEALASLSDISSLEIRTKARGMPNAYYKIVKGSKCLFFGMDDEREAVGTTVIVRDLFYNQPVRRNYMQSSPKRVLHSIKKCVLRIALIHPQVSFRVIDCASEDELLFTVPSPSPLSLVSDGFGSEVSSSLREVAFSDHGLILSGYMSGCTNTFSTKGFQYLYINSRFVSKGPIHNLLNSLAANIQCSLAHYMVEPEFQSGKKHKAEGYPAFLLNLHCPVTSYDLHFEPSKTVAEFKDWNAVLSFCGQATKHFWEQIPSKPLEGNTLAHTDGLPTGSAIKEAGISKRSKIKRAECSIQLDHNDFSHSPVTGLLDISLEDTDVYDKQVRGPKYRHTFSLLKPFQRNVRYLDQASYSSEHVIHESLDTFGSKAPISGTYGIEQWIGNTDYSLLENNIFPDQNPKLEDRRDVSDRKWKNGLSEDLGNLDKGADCSFLNSDPFSIPDNDDNFQFSVPRCSSHKQIENKNSQSVENEQGYSVLHTNYRSFCVGLDCLGDGSFYANNHSTKTAHLNGCLVTGTLSMETNSIPSPSLDAIKKCQMTRDFDGPSHHLVNPFSSDERSVYGKDSLPDRLASEFWVTNSKCRSPEMDWHLDSHQRSAAKRLRTVHDYTQGSTSRTHLLSVTSAGCRMNSDGAEEDTEISNSVQNTSNEVCPVKCSIYEFDIQDYCSPKRHMLCRSPSNQNAFVKARPSALSNDELGWSPLNSSNMKSAEAYSKYAFHNSLQDLHDENESFQCKMEYKNSRASDVHRVRSRRSCSAPPFYKGKSRFPTLNNPETKMTGKNSTFGLYFSETAPENICSLDGLSRLCFASQSCHKPNINVSQPIFRKCINEKMTTHVVQGIQSIKGYDKECNNQSSHKNAAEFKLEDALTMLSKWRTGIPQPPERNVAHKNNDDVLNISSGILHLTGSSLVPESISKDCLDDARVLQQLDRKFIPVMAGNVLVIIDQHAADERIRLEELREKVLSGEGNTVSYLDSELELVLPEMGYQLLQKYGDQIQKWGWVCNIRSQCSESFAKNVNLLKRHRSGVTLIAVPCILGINLNDKDLVEFIEQLVETDGSSTIPPSVLRILNFKACRGAIMFGDSLLPSECSLIVEELKATSLCFQCAHGRPTTVPLVNVASLHEQLVNLEMEKGAGEERWHGLCTHAPSIERARQRLVSAKRFQGG